MDSFDNDIKIIDLTDISDSEELQELLMEELDFPSFYGKNWDAFWDAITALVDMPENIIITGFEELLLNLPKDAAILKNILDKYNDEYPGHNIELLP